MKQRASVIVEVVALLFVVGLLAAVAIPDYDENCPQLRERVLIGSLKTVRTALQRYWGDHNAVYPSFEELDALRQVSLGARPRAGLAAFLERLPENPYTQGNRLGLPQEPVGATDWVYDPHTGAFKANDSQAHRDM